VKGHFDFGFWVSQCPDLFEPIDILRKMIAKFEPKNVSLDHYGKDKLISMLSELLKEKRCLVVIDNFSWHGIWKLVREAVPDENNGTRVLIISQVISSDGQEKIIPDPEDPYHYRLPPLTNEESLKLLCRKPSDKKDFLEDYHPEFRLLAEEMATLCGGCPKVLKLIGAHMLLNPSFSPRSVVIWDDKFFYSILDIIPNVYLYLPSVLKTCLAYLASLFPCHYMIHADILVRLWIAEGFIQPEDGRTMEDTAESYLEELIQRYNL
jgi:disease resistance protein RPM1